MVAAVPMTPMRPFRVCCTAVWAVGRSTSRYGTGSASPMSRAVELTVPQAASTAFTSCCRRKFMSCFA